MLAVSGPPAMLEWDAPAECPDEAAVVERIDALLGSNVAQISTHAHVRRASGGWRARLTVAWRGHTDQRELLADDCRSLAEATALLVAVMADPVHAAAELSGAPDSADAPALPALPTNRAAPTRAPATRTTPEGDSPPLPAPAAPPPREHHERGAAVTVGVMLDAGSLPRVTPAPTLGVGWRGRGFRLLAEGFVLPPRPVRSSLDGAQQAQVMVGAARIGACARLGPRRAEVALCTITELGGATGTGFGRSGQGRADDLWVAAAGRAGLVIPVTRRLALSAGVEMAAALRVIEYRIDGQLVHRTGPIALRGHLGVEFRIPSQRSAQPENR